MKFVNHINFRVFSNPDEDKAKIKNTLLSLVGYTLDELEIEKIKFVETSAKGFNQKTIFIFQASLEKERHCNVFFKKLNEKLSDEDKKALVEQENRVDDNLTFFMRLDKNELFEDRYVLTETGNCFHISMSLDAHPKRKEVALEIVKKIFKK
jgi:RNA binding exosome subunit